MNSTPSLEDFHAEVRAWLQAHCPSDMREPLRGRARRVLGRAPRAVPQSDTQRVWRQRIGERGWTVPRWPRE